MGGAISRDEGGSKTRTGLVASKAAEAEARHREQALGHRAATGVGSLPLPSSFASFSSGPAAGDSSSIMDPTDPLTVARGATAISPRSPGSSSLAPCWFTRGSSDPTHTETDPAARIPPKQQKMDAFAETERKGSSSSSAPPSSLPLSLPRWNQQLFSPLYSLVIARCDDASSNSSALPPPPSPVPPPLPPVGAEAGASQDVGDPSLLQADGSFNASAVPPPSTSLFPNPGPMEQATLEVRRLIALDTFDGFRVDINKQVSPYMAAVHSFWLGTGMIPDGRKSTYSFVSQVADEKGLLMARVDPGKWSLDGRIHRAVLGGMAMGKVQVSVSPQSSGGGDGSDAGGGGSSDQLLAELDFGGLTWTGNLKYGSMGGGIVLGCNYYQSVTRNCAVGGEGMYVAANQALLSNYLVKFTIPAKTGDEDLLGTVAAGGAGASSSAPTTSASPPTSVALGGGGSSTFCLSYNAGHGAATIGYRRVVTPNRVQLAGELQFSPFTLDSKLLLGAEFKLSRSRLCFCVDPGELRIQSLVEARLGMSPGSPTLNLSADVNHLEDEMRFGYGLTIDS